MIEKSCRAANLPILLTLRTTLHQAAGRIEQQLRVEGGVSSRVARTPQQVIDVPFLVDRQNRLSVGPVNTASLLSLACTCRMSFPAKQPRA